MATDPLKLNTFIFLGYYPMQLTTFQIHNYALSKQAHTKCCSSSIYQTGYTNHTKMLADVPQ